MLKCRHYAEASEKKAKMKVAGLRYKCVEVTHFTILLLRSNLPSGSGIYWEHSLSQGRLCPAEHVDAAMCASSRSRRAFESAAKGNSSCAEELRSMKEAIEFSYYDLDGFIRLVRLALKNSTNGAEDIPSTRRYLLVCANIVHMNRSHMRVTYSATLRRQPLQPRCSQSTSSSLLPSARPPPSVSQSASKTDAIKPDGGGLLAISTAGSMHALKAIEPSEIAVLPRMFADYGCKGGAFTDECAKPGEERVGEKLENGAGGPGGEYAAR
ncbi:hypothetical protein MUK42_31663 [Musa troglodytarum]|uniref:Uncharacterized protein n=1 Tax=Musa troglodytarum TaxID=320322 RepID=A0A9E7FN53_9LILI|nr:hypothetical protein MUK42_31663 [Musa troglodytarum]